MHRSLQRTKASLKAAEDQERKDFSLRKSFLQRRADALALNGDQTSAKYLKRLKQCEDTARVFDRCRDARGLVVGGGFSSIQVPSDPSVHPKQATHWRTVDVPQEVATMESLAHIFLQRQFDEDVVDILGVTVTNQRIASTNEFPTFPPKALKKVYDIAPPMIKVSTFSSNFSIMRILSEILAPPMMAVNGRSAFSSTF